MSEIGLRLENRHFWDAANKSRDAAPLSARSAANLEACRGSTREKPCAGLSYSQCFHLRDKELLDYRGFDKSLGSGGHFLTEAGRMALRNHYESQGW